VHAACAFGSSTEDNAGQGRGEHRPGLDEARPAVVAGAVVALGTTAAARASCTDTATPDRALVLVTTVNCGATFEFDPTFFDEFRQ
jgi:hypothetical protein